MDIKTPASSEQVNALLDFLEHHKDLACGRLRNNMGRNHAAMLWQQITHKLNSMNGAVKREEQWRKIWCDRKYAARKNFQGFRSTVTAGGEQIPLCDTDMKVLSILYEDSEYTAKTASGSCPLPSFSGENIQTQCFSSAVNKQTYPKPIYNVSSTSKAQPMQLQETSHRKTCVKPEENKESGGLIQKETTTESAKERQRQPIQMEISEILVERENDLAGEEKVARKNEKSFLKPRGSNKKIHVDDFASTTQMLRYFEKRREQTENVFLSELKGIGSTLRELLALVEQFKGEPMDRLTKQLNN